MHPSARHLKVTLFSRAEPWEGYLYLPDTLPETFTVEDVLHVLNDSRLFIPTGTEQPPFLWLVNKSAIRCIRWAFEQHETMETRVPWDRRERVRILFEPEGKLNGYLVMIHRAEQSLRVQDLMNLPEPFVVVIDQVDPVIWFVNKNHINRMGHIHD